MKIKYNVIGSTCWNGSRVKEYKNLEEFKNKTPDITEEHIKRLRNKKHVNVKKSHNLYEMQYSIVEE